MTLQKPGKIVVEIWIEIMKGIASLLKKSLILLMICIRILIHNIHEYHVLVFVTGKPQYEKLFVLVVIIYYEEYVKVY